MRYAALKSALLATALVPVAAAAQDESLVVATGLMPLYSITAELTENTGIVVRNLPTAPASMATLARLLERVDPAEMADADAVVTIGGVWPEDPLFAAIRSHNIRVVEIDASVPLSGGRDGVALVQAPTSRPDWRDAPEIGGAEHSRYVWLSLANTLRMAEIIAGDLKRLAPEETDGIEANLGHFQADVRALMLEANNALAVAKNVAAYALTDKFAYLLNDLAIFVDGSFIEQDIRWTAEDFAGIEETLESHRIPMVVHEWAPEQPIVDAVAAAGADLVVLDAMDPALETAEPSADFYLETMRANIDRITGALASQ
jgi:ABC-type Zn uptake system ZnuABC Zn-binding protein ZnuA